MAVRRRRRGPGPLVFLIIVLLSAAVGAAVWSMVTRMQTLPPPGYQNTITVEVLNGCGEDGAARRVASILRKSGYDVARTGRADSYHYRRDVVVLRNGLREEAELLAETLGGDAAVVFQRPPESPYNATVIVGRPHYLAPVENP